MTFFKNTISLLAIFSIIPTAHAAAAARPSIMNAFNTASAASRRMPSARTSPVTPVANNTTSSTGILDEIECIDAYTECIASDDTCGSDFEECTTNVLFHAQMPKCTSTLLQCTSAGINRLFGTTDVASLSNVDSYVADTQDAEVARYTFPSDGSVMGQRIIAGAIANTYDTQSCVKNYMRCLNKDDVCGADFELCTDDKDFKKQALYCESTLARCQTEGLKELFGDSGRAAKGSPAVGSRIKAAITSGAELAALNAVTTCYKTADNCLLSVCKQNPLRCIEGTSVDLLQAANKINADGTEDSAVLNDQGTVTSDVTKSNINRFLRSSCEDKIGSNKYCHMTVFEKTPTKKDLANIDKISEVFEDILDSRKGIVLSQVQGLAQKFDSNAKAACTKTIQECAMRTCGGGSGAACWTQVYGDNGTKSIGKDTPYSDIETGCAAIVNTDPNCVYAAQSVSSTATTYNYDYIDGNAFSSLFGASDPIGAVASLNSLLATSYNAAAIENMGKQCQKLATSCVRSMCGNDFVNCYRNRTDIYSNLTDTSNIGFDKSMNKVGGVLDYTIVLGLCADTVRNADTCSEHLKIAKASINTDATADTWGSPDKSVSENWRASGQGLLSFKANGKDSVQKENENGELLCKNSKGEEGVCDTCSGGTDSCDLYNIAVMQSVDAYKNSYAVTSLFKELIADLEIEAQAKYNAKLTKQQNMCLAANAGGIMGGNDMSSIYKWVKLGNGGRVPNDYSIQGLKTSQFKASNDLYGSFCAVRVTLQSDDPDIMAALSGNYAGQTFKRLGTGNHELRADTNLDVDLSGSASRYFAIGDPITCGSWLSMTEIEKLAQVVEAKAKSAKEKTQNTSLRTWMPILGAAGGALGGAFLGDAIQDGSALSGLLDKPKVKSKDSTKSSCQQWSDKFASTYDVYYANKIIEMARKADENNAKATRAETLIEYIDDPEDTEATWMAVFNKTTAPGAKTTCYDGSTYDSDCLQKEARSKAKTEIRNLISVCERGQEQYCKDNSTAEECKEKTWWQRDGGTLVGSLVTGAATAGLAYAVTDSVLNAELDKAGQEAYQAFMDSIGSKIHCYIGSQEVATYGQVIETSME
ncbi:MAG: hypothetical protein R8N24_02205 [Alphaproteobacteria bacterium]|nr:hypothetical protein [Alphaproteobacteria bacterium]